MGVLDPIREGRNHRDGAFARYRFDCLSTSLLDQAFEKGMERLDFRG